jgi:LmbE family N-acetylglucosaminyl deacetylase
VGTIVSFHAHPDDESITVGGTLARAAAAGHRVVLVFATRGELGEAVEGALEPGEQLSIRRSAECHASAAVLGAKRVEFLGYTDSGAMGAPSNDAPYCFWQAGVEHAARLLAVILDEEEADILTTYDDNGGSGNPDRIQVHRVGRRAAELSGVPVVAQNTTNRDWMTRGARGMAEQAGRTFEPAADVPQIGKPESEITHRVEVVDFVERKRASIAAHTSQIGPDHFLLTMPDAVFAMGLGTEFYIVDPAPNPAVAPEVFEELFVAMR